jgi:NRAMP (natural resistance-associated macrophage protein)-like metal ion transporter
VHRAGVLARSRKPRKRRWWQLFGPGLITGASDDDPSGIATYSQVGAQFRYGMLWTMLFSFPLMSAIQETSARIGRVTGHGIAGNLRREYPKWLLFGAVSLLVIANTINIGADIAAMGEAARLAIGGGPLLGYAAGFALLSVTLEVFVTYRRYARILMTLTASLLAYVISVAVVDVAWGDALEKTALPSIHFRADYFLGVVAVLGTTISPYLFFWQASQEVEEEQAQSRARPLVESPHTRPPSCRGSRPTRSSAWPSRT